MAAIALLAKIAPMHIIIIVATVAGLRHDDTVVHRQFMASVANYFLMCAIQLEFGTRIVIKIPGLPGSGVVAGIAFFTEPALMHLVIVLLVTGKAIGWRIAEYLGQMAFLAFHFDMQPKQREACTPMIEPCIFPILFAMAGFTAFTQTSLVHVVFRMAGDAFLRQLLLIQLVGMAGDTLDLLVLAL